MCSFDKSIHRIKCNRVDKCSERGFVKTEPPEVKLQKSLHYKVGEESLHSPLSLSWGLRPPTKASGANLGSASSGCQSLWSVSILPEALSDSQLLNQVIFLGDAGRVYMSYYTNPFTLAVHLVSLPLVKMSESYVPRTYLYAVKMPELHLQRNFLLCSKNARVISREMVSSSLGWSLVKLDKLFYKREGHSLPTLFIYRCYLPLLSRFFNVN